MMFSESDHRGVFTAAHGAVVLHVLLSCNTRRPSRTQMLIGRYAYHVGQQSDNLGPTNGGCALSVEYDMIPAALKKYAPASYHTHAFGKYHQGFYAKR